MPYVNVEIDWDEFTDYELLEELESRDISNLRIMYNIDRFQAEKLEYLKNYIDEYSILELKVIFEDAKKAKAGLNQLSLEL